MRLNSTNTSVGAVEILTHVPVRKPSRHEFFRVHPDHILDTTVFIDKEERETYLVIPSMRAASRRGGTAGTPRSGHQPPERTVHLACPAPERGRPAQCLDGHGTRGDARSAEENWIRLMPDMGLGAYRIYQAEGQLSDPIWPDKPFEELLEIAFKDRVIDSPDHPVVRRLRGLT